jgi:predicted nucleotidyltransferase
VYHPEYNIAIDLLPFGEIEENYTINFNERFTDLHVLGFKEVLEVTNEIRIEEKIAKIPSLHGMILLKLVAWADRPEERPNDPYDILRIIEYYYLYNLNEIHDNHYDIFPEDNFDQLKISARVLGRKAAQILQKSEKLSVRIFTILKETKMNPVKSSFIRQWVQQKDWTFEYAVEILNEFETGLKENINQKS